MRSAYMLHFVSIFGKIAWYAVSCYSKHFIKRTIMLITIPRNNSRTDTWKSVRKNKLWKISSTMLNNNQYQSIMPTWSLTFTLTPLHIGNIIAFPLDTAIGYKSCPVEWSMNVTVCHWEPGSVVYRIHFMSGQIGYCWANLDQHWKHKEENDYWNL